MGKTQEIELLWGLLNLHYEPAFPTESQSAIHKTPVIAGICQTSPKGLQHVFIKVNIAFLLLLPSTVIFQRGFYVKANKQGDVSDLLCSGRAILSLTTCIGVLQ